MKNLTSVIPAKGDVPYLKQCIDAVNQISEKILIIDLGIDEKILASVMNNPKIMHKKWPHEVDYIEQIRTEMFAQVDTEYILYLDADEVMTPTLIDWIEKNGFRAKAYAFARKNIIFSQWIQHARWWPDYQIRLFRKGSVEWPKSLHAQPIIDDKHVVYVPVSLELSFVHYNYSSIDEFVQKMTRYAKAEAKYKIDHTVNYSLHQAVKAGLSEFMSRFWAGHGYKDGQHGFVLSFLQMIYPFFVYFYWWEKKNYKAKNEPIEQEAQYFFRQGFKETAYWENQLKPNSLKQKIYYWLSKFV